jgi:hypothetical protein
MSVKICLRGNSSLVAVDKAIYSLSVVERAISVWSLLHHVTGHPQKYITKPVLDKTFSHKVAYSVCHTPAKSASTNISRVKDLFGFTSKPLSFVADKYLTIHLTASSWIAFGCEQYLAH